MFNRFSPASLIVLSINARRWVFARRRNFAFPIIRRISLFVQRTSFRPASLRALHRLAPYSSLTFTSGLPAIFASCFLHAPPRVVVHYSVDCTNNNYRSCLAFSYTTPLLTPSPPCYPCTSMSFQYQFPFRLESSPIIPSTVPISIIEGGLAFPYAATFLYWIRFHHAVSLHAYTARALNLSWSLLRLFNSNKIPSRWAFSFFVRC